MRLEAGLQQANLAVLLDQPQSFVSKYESGERILESPASGSSAEVFGGSVTENREETAFPMTERQRDVPEQINCRATCEKWLWERSEIILLHAGTPKRQIAEDMETDIKTVHKWCGRWEESRPGLRSAEEAEEKGEISPAEYEKKVAEVLGNASLPGTPHHFSPEQVVHVVAI